MVLLALVVELIALDLLHTLGPIRKQSDAAIVSGPLMGPIPPKCQRNVGLTRILSSPCPVTQKERHMEQKEKYRYATTSLMRVCTSGTRACSLFGHRISVHRAGQLAISSIDREGLAHGALDVESLHLLQLHAVTHVVVKVRTCSPAPTRCSSRATTSRI